MPKRFLNFLLVHVINSFENIKKTNRRLYPKTIWPFKNEKISQKSLSKIYVFERILQNRNLKHVQWGAYQSGYPDFQFIMSRLRCSLMYKTYKLSNKAVSVSRVSHFDFNTIAN